MTETLFDQMKGFVTRGVAAQRAVDKLCGIPKKFDGQTYDDRLDGPRLKHQLERVREYMLAIFPHWKTLSEISVELGRLYPTTRFPEASISARLRDLRKEKFGGYTVKHKRRTAGTYEYLIYKGD